MFFCKHDWKLLSNITTESIFEMTIRNLKDADRNTGRQIPWQLCDGGRKHIQTLNCIKCGKIKRFVEQI